MTQCRELRWPLRFLNKVNGHTSMPLNVLVKVLSYHENHISFHDIWIWRGPWWNRRCCINWSHNTVSHIRSDWPSYGLNSKQICSNCLDYRDPSPKHRVGKPVQINNNLYPYFIHPYQSNPCRFGLPTLKWPEPMVYFQYRVYRFNYYSKIC